MNYGKNQLALLDFLHKHPNKWHKIKRRKAIDAAERLHVRLDYFYRSHLSNSMLIYLHLPQMLVKQN